MVQEEVPASEASVTMTDETLAPLPGNVKNQDTQASKEGNIDSASQGGADSTCNNNENGSPQNSALTSSGEGEKTLEFADELAEKGSKALKESDYAEAVECFSRALEIKVAHYGELAFECMNAYYQYGRALLYKAQEEADPLGNVPKKKWEPQLESDKEGHAKNVLNIESSTASVSCKIEQDGNTVQQEGEVDDGTSTGRQYVSPIFCFLLHPDAASTEKDQEENGNDSDNEDLTEADEDESDLDLSWKMLDIARAIAEKHSGDTMEKVEVLSTLAEVSLEREDIESSLSDYQKALSILDKLVEPDSRHIAALNFRLCLCLEIGSKPQEAIPYCQKAISICKARVQRLMNEVKDSAGSATASVASEIDDGAQQSANVSQQTESSVADKEAEIETLSSLSEDLEKKLEDLQQLALNPKSILSEILGIPSLKAKSADKAASSTVVDSSQMGTVKSNSDLESPTVSTAHTNGAAGVTHLGVVGRGVKRVLMNASPAESSVAKKPSLELDSSSDKGDGNAC